MTAMPSTNCSAVTHLVWCSSTGTCCGGATLASQPTLNFAVSTKIHCSLLLNWSADMFWKAWSGGIGAQPVHSGLVRQTTQPGLNAAPGSQAQPICWCQNQRPQCWTIWPHGLLSLQYEP